MKHAYFAKATQTIAFTVPHISRAKKFANAMTACLWLTPVKTRAYLRMGMNCLILTLRCVSSSVLQTHGWRDVSAFFSIGVDEATPRVVLNPAWVLRKSDGVHWDFVRTQFWKQPMQMERIARELRSQMAGNEQVVTKIGTVILHKLGGCYFITVDSKEVKYFHDILA